MAAVWLPRCSFVPVLAVDRQVRHPAGPGLIHWEWMKLIQDEINGMDGSNSGMDELNSMEWVKSRNG